LASGLPRPEVNLKHQTKRASSVQTPGEKMKLTHIIQKPVPTPPNRVILDMTENEAGLLYFMADYYHRLPANGYSVRAASRLRDRLFQYKDKFFKEDSAFEIEE
jgi:hypothetical protein